MNQEQLRKEAAENYAKGIGKFSNQETPVFTKGDVDYIVGYNSRASFIAGAEWEAEREKWISVEDALPKHLECVLARAVDKRPFMENEPPHHQVVFLDYDNKFYQAGMRLFETVMHWQYITPPKTSK